MVIFHSYVSLPEVPILKLSWDWDLTFLWRIISTSLRWLQHHRIPIPPFQEESGDLNSSLRRLMTWVWATTQNMQTLPGKCVSSIYVGFPGEISSYQNSGCKLDQSYPLAMKHGLLDNLHLVPWSGSQAAESSKAGLGENEERLGVLHQRFAALVAGWRALHRCMIPMGKRMVTGWTSSCA